MRAFLFSSVLIFLTVPLCISDAQESNAGIVQGLWYSQEKIFSGDVVRIYVAIRNNTGSDLSGTVEFFDGDIRIERKSVQALDGRIIESWADWKPTYGTHTLSANLARTELHKVGSSTQAVEVTSALAEDSIFVDHDTDKDGVGNEDDTDDDADGISDAQEKQNGTDPLVRNTQPTAQEDEEEDTEDTAQATEDTRKVDDSNSTSEDHPEGLERFLADSPAENVLASVTEYITTAKQNLDEYRENREEKQTLASTTTKPAVNADGFGEITRATTSDAGNFSGFDFGDFFASVFKLIGVMFSTAYTLVLAILSFVLAHPILVQVGILVLILFLLIKFASKFGRRPGKFK
jgi:hypothetical protein